jgi:hypothetical protein
VLVLQLNGRRRFGSSHWPLFSPSIEESFNSVVLLVAGSAAFVALFRICAAAGWDWPFSLGLSLIPLLSLAAHVHLMVNGKAPL